MNAIAVTHIHFMEQASKMNSHRVGFALFPVVYKETQINMKHIILNSIC